jgi:hypothetical protein
VVDRRFWVADSRRADFEASFAFGGLWARLLYQASGYLFTEVRCESSELVQYRIKDFWCEHQGFEGFRERFQSEYERFENWLISDGIIEREQFLGAYYEKPSDEDDFIDLVL